MEEKDTRGYRLTDEQAEEVRRRLADPDPETMTLAEARASLRKRGA